MLMEMGQQDLNSVLSNSRFAPPGRWKYFKILVLDLNSILSNSRLAPPSRRKYLKILLLDLSSDIIHKKIYASSFVTQLMAGLGICSWL